MKGVPAIGQFNRRVTVKETQTTKNSAGDIINGDHTPLYETWAAFQYDSSRAQFLQQAEALLNVFEIWIRLSTEHPVNQANIIEYEGKDYTITTIAEVKEGNKSFYNMIIKTLSNKA